MSLLIFVLFLIFAGKVTVEILIIDAVITVVFALFMHKFLDYPLKQNLVGICMLPFRIKYVAVLLSEIVKANVAVIKFIVSFKYDVEPVLVLFDSGLKTKSARVLLANSITLTPGTITAKLDGDHFVVHALDKDMAEGITESSLVREIKTLENVELKLRAKFGVKSSK